MEKMAYSIFGKTAKYFGIKNFSFQSSIVKVLILLIVILAAFLRLYRIEDYMTFLGDEGRDVLVVYNILHGRLTLLGPTASVGGFFLGPIYYYFMSPFLWAFNYNPVGPAVMVALFGVAAVFLIYKVGSEFFGKKVGLIAAFLYAISPLVIAYSRSSWNPNLMPFFSLLAMYVLYKAIVKNKIKLFLLCGFLFGILMQLHYLTIFLGIIAVSYIAITKRKILLILKDYLFMLIGFIVGWSPFLVFEFKHGFINLKSIVSFVFGSGDTGGNSHFFSTIYNVFFRLFARLIANFPPPEQVSLKSDFGISAWYYLTFFLAVLSVGMLFKKLLKNINNKKEFLKISLLFLWLFIGISLFGFYKKPIYDYYFGFMFPLPFFLIGLLISNLFKKKFGILIGVIILVFLSWVNLKGMPFLFPANRQFRQVEEISRFVLNKTGNKPFNFALITDGNSDHAYRYFFKTWNKDPIVIQNEKNDPKRETVTEQLLIVCESSSCHPLGHSVWEIAGFGRAEIEDEWDVSVVKVFKLKHYTGT